MAIIARNNLSQLIRERGMTHQQFADELGLSRTYVSQLCRAQTLSLKKIETLLNALGEDDITKLIEVVRIEEKK